MNPPTHIPLIACELLLKSSVIIAAAALAAHALRRSPAALRHVTWSAAFIGLLLVPLLGTLTPHWAPALISASRNLPTIVGTASPDRIGTASPLAESTDKSGAVKPAGHQTYWTLALVGVWAIGAGLLIFQRCLGSLRLGLLRKSSPLLLDSRIKAISDGILLELGIERTVELRTSTRTLVPMTWGTRHLVLLLPSEALSWSDERIDAAIRHEAAHIARRDYLTNFVAQIACSLYWPNPLVWLALRSLHTAQEQAADDFVIRAGTVPEHYACQLLDLARKLSAQSVDAAPFSIAMARPSTLESRMLAIMDERRSRSPISLRAASAAFVPVVLVLALCSMTRLIAEENVPTAQRGKVPTASIQFTPAAAASPIQTDPFAKIIIEQLELNDATLTSAVDFLRNSAKAQGADSFNIVIPKMPAPEPHVTVSLSKVPISQAVQFIASAAGLQVRGDARGFVLVSGSSATSPTIAIQAETTAAADPSAKIIIEKVDLNDVTLSAAIDTLRKSARAQGAESFDIVVPKMPTPEPRVTLSLSKIPLPDAVRYLATLAGLQVRIDSHGYVLEKEVP